MGASIINAIPASYNYLKNSSSVSGIAADLNYRANKAANSVETKIKQGTTNTIDYFKNTSGTQLGIL